MNAAELQTSLTGFVSDEIECRAVDGRVACALPLAYPDGDGVVVYVSERDQGFEVSDYSEAIRMLVARPGIRLKPLAALARATAESHGITYGDGRLSASTSRELLEDVVWRVGQASAELAQTLAAQRPEPVRDESLADEIERALQERGVTTERGHRLEGASGHSYHATLFLPQTHTILEPLSSEGGWASASAIYVEFGDISRSNGYRPLAVIDDREREPDEQLLQLLVQVGDVARWTERTRWLSQVTER
jgi:Domain of unknown function DUF1828